MQITALLVVVWAVVVATLGAVRRYVDSGGMLSTYPRARPFVPLFLIVIPATVIGAFFGGLVVGILSVRVDEG
ncbi:MAG TPA: hypothetical protein VJ813_03180 [Vicinamibacterales bacterium]|nr:hypothetical protein [Vicinamibacterales bacterium]